MKLRKIEFGRRDIETAHIFQNTILENMNFTKLGQNKFGKWVFKDNSTEQKYQLKSYDLNKQELVLVETNVNWKLDK